MHRQEAALTAPVSGIGDASRLAGTAGAGQLHGHLVALVQGVLPGEGGGGACEAAGRRLRVVGLLHKA